MRLTLRVLINILNNVDNQLDQVDNELRVHPEYREKFRLAKRQLIAAIRAFSQLNDEMGDKGIN